VSQSDPSQDTFYWIKPQAKSSNCFTNTAQADRKDNILLTGEQNNMSNNGINLF
jgi:hypothetical protein